MPLDELHDIDRMTPEQYNNLDQYDKDVFSNRLMLIWKDRFDSERRVAGLLARRTLAKRIAWAVFWLCMTAVLAAFLWMRGL